MTVQILYSPIKKDVKQKGEETPHRVIKDRKNGPEDSYRG